MTRIGSEGSSLVRFLHTSDWQIGMRGGGLGRAADTVRQRRIETIERLLALATERECDFVVAAGDLFENNGVDQSQVDDVARRLRAFPNLEIHAIPGNHDLPGPGSVFNRAVLRNVPNLRIHVVPEPIALPELGVTLHPFPVTSKHSLGDPLEGCPDVSGVDGVHVGLAHGHVITATFGGHEGDVKLPIDPAHVERCGLDYLALGHWHGTRTFNSGDGAARIAYSGTHERTAYDETDAGQVLVVEIERKGASPTIEAVPTGALRWDDVIFRFAGDAEVDRFRRAIEAVDADLVRVIVEGEAPSRVYAAYREVLSALEPRVLDARIDDGRLRWTADEDEDPLGPLTDASLAEVARRIELGPASGESGQSGESGESGASSDTRNDAAVAREAALLFARAVREVGLCD